ncbi:MAG: TVP38/TMEM64 family protein, partial [Acetivibrio ethanolgignens]
MKNKKLGIFAGAVILVLILNHSFGWSSYIGDMDNLKRLEGIVQDNLLLALVIYIGFTIAGCVVLALPGVTFAIAAGLLFGPLLGTVCCSMATTIGAMLAFAAGRFFLKDSVKPVVIKNRYLKRWLFDESEKNEVFVLMLTRLVPLFPYNLQNFAYGITDIKFSTYSICSLIFMLPGTAMYTVGAAGLTDRENRLLYIGIAAFLAVIVTGLGVFLKKR